MFRHDAEAAFAKRFYAVLAIAMAIGLALDYVGLDAVKMLFWSAIVNVPFRVMEIEAAITAILGGKA